MIGPTLRTDSLARTLFSKSSLFVVYGTCECLLVCSSFLTLHLFPFAFFRFLWWNDRIKNGWSHNAKLFRLKLWYLYSLIFICFSEYSNQLHFKFVNLKITWMQILGLDSVFSVMSRKAACIWPVNLTIATLFMQMLDIIANQDASFLKK